MSRAAPQRGPGMEPGRERDLEERVRKVCPRFRAAPAGRHGHRTLKSCLLLGDLDGAPAIAKILTHPHPMWRWYHEREIALYAHFAQHPPPVSIPRVYAADRAACVLVLERLPGEPLGRYRRAPAPLEAPMLAALLAAVARLRSWNGWSQSEDPPPERARRELRARLLEDPAAPLAWICEGIARCVRLALVDAGAAALMQQALRGSPQTAFAHGDLLLRNVLWSPSGLAFVDWECAGSYLRDWDLALLWTGLQSAVEPLPLLRMQKELRSTEDSPAEHARRWPAFIALAAFALLRELKFCRPRSARRTDPAYRRQEELQARLAEVLKVLRSIY